MTTVSNIFFIRRFTSLGAFQFIWQKGPKRDGDLKILLITVGHMASCNLSNFFLKVWKLVQMYHFLVESFG